MNPDDLAWWLEHNRPALLRVIHSQDRSNDRPRTVEEDDILNSVALYLLEELESPKSPIPFQVPADGERSHARSGAAPRDPEALSPMTGFLWTLATRYIGRLYRSWRSQQARMDRSVCSLDESMDDMDHSFLNLIPDPETVESLFSLSECKNEIRHALDNLPDDATRQVAVSLMMEEPIPYIRKKTGFSRNRILHVRRRFRDSLQPLRTERS